MQGEKKQKNKNQTTALKEPAAEKKVPEYIPHFHFITHMTDNPLFQRRTDSLQSPILPLEDKGHLFMRVHTHKLIYKTAGVSVHLSL